MNGQQISHYTILERLGEGGMGIVYKAKDTDLDRTVALKFLPAHAALSGAERDRLLQEAKIAAALNHPNICMIYGIEKEGDQQFLVLEFIDGVTLREKCPYPSVSEAVSVAIQIAEGLQEAHARGIVHRDIKSDNIMVTQKGQVKVMDFGLAKLRGSLKLTRTSSTIGTLAYMAPEQVQGGEVDARSDVFSFGVLLFEMLTGKTPFRGEHEASMMYSILNEQPESILHVLPECPAGMVQILDKALEKNPDHRYQSMADLLADLRRLKRDTATIRTAPPVESPLGSQTETAPSSGKTQHHRRFKPWLVGALGGVIGLALLLVLFWPAKQDTTAVGRKTLAVLPFENQGAADKEYFADGITEEITTRLSGLSGLGVIARSSAREYKKTEKPLRQIGAELGVDYVLMGTVRWSSPGGRESRVRVSPELVRVSSGLQIWSQTFEAPYSDAFSMQANIAAQVARALDVTLLQTETKSLSEQLTDNADAYDFYLRGIEYGSRGIAREDMVTAIQMFERAITEDPRFAAAYAQMAMLHSDMYWFFYDRSESRINKCRTAADKALELAPELSDAYAAQGWYYYHCNLDYESALKEFGLALERQPNNANVYYGIAAVRRRQGMMHESAESFKKAVSGNPRAADINRQYGETLTLLRDYEEADRTYDRTILLNPSEEDAYTEKAENILLWKGDRAKAGEVLKQRDKHIDHHRADLTLSVDFRLDLMNGQYDKALRLVETTPTEDGASYTQFWYTPVEILKGEVYDLQGNAERAKSSYEKARAHLEQMLKATPGDERLHSSLGIALAGLGRSSEAIREGKRGVELLPVEREAWRGTFRLKDLALIYTMVGEKEKAVDVLERLLSIPSELSRTLLALDPAWRSLRGNKRFDEITTRGH